MLVERASPGGEGRVTNATGQLWALRARIKTGDLLVMPLKTARPLALGRVITGYQYPGRESASDAPCRRCLLAAHRPAA